MQRFGVDKCVIDVEERPKTFVKSDLRYVTGSIDNEISIPV